MSERLRLAIVGCGDIARYTALFSRLNRKIQLVACCDREMQRAEQFADRYKIRHRFQDYHALLDLNTLDAVYLAVPHDLHLEMTRDALQSGRHVLLEKPIARTVEEGERLVALADASRLCVGVNYQYRYDSGCYALAQAARSGQLGELYYGRGHLPWFRDLRYFEISPWHAALSRSGGGTLITQGSHMLDVLLWAMDGPPLRAFGETAQRKFHSVEVEDLAMGIVELEGGARISVTSSMAAKPEQAIRIEIYGERGTGIYSNQPLPHVRFKGVRIKKQRPPVRGLHALQRSVEGFRAWVVEGKPYLIPASEALPVLAAVSAIYKAAKTERKEPVHLPVIR
jgi:predicted dehydrogenase